MTRWLVRRELAIALGARVTWMVAAIAALLVGHAFVLAVDLYSAASRSALANELMRRELDPLAGIVRPALGGLSFAAAVLLPVAAARGLAIEKQRGSYGALALRAGSTHPVVLAKLVAALAAAPLLLAPPVILLLALAALGGSLDPVEVGIALLGHALALILLTAVSLAAAAATRTVAQATVLAIALSLASWAVDASSEFAALAWMEPLEWASIGRRLAPFEHGVLAIGAVAWLVVASVSAAVIGLVLARIAHTPRRMWLAGAIGVVTVVLLAALGQVQRGYDLSERHRQSFPAEIVDGLRALPGDLAVDVWLDRDDGRRTELEKGPLARLQLARPDCALGLPLDRAAGALAGRDADYGRLVIRIGAATRETRSSSDDEIVRAIFDAAGRAMPAWHDPAYPGYPLVIDGTARTLVLALAYLVLPLTLVVTGGIVTRSRRRRS